MTRIITGLTKRVWLHLLKEGGRWVTLDLSKALGANPNAMRMLLHSMAESGFVRAWQSGSTGRNRKPRRCFGVTPDCKVPVGTTIEELAACGAITYQQEAA